MCGVFGFSELNPRTRFMSNFLAYSMENRGDDSWGASNGEEVIKKVGPITASFYIPKNWKSGIFHTRGASVGAVTVKNAHPFDVRFNGKRIIGIHNGGVSNHKELNEKYKRHCEVDSEHIFLQMVEGKRMAELSGRGTIVWYGDYQGKNDVIHLARWNFGDLEVAELKDNGLVFCSERVPIVKAARCARVEIVNFYQTPVDGWEHVFDGKDFRKIEDMKFRDYRQEEWFKAWEKDVKKCKKCHSTQTKFVVCTGCMQSFRREFEKIWQRAA